jgi:protein TonB
MEGRLFEDLVVSRAANTQARAAGVPFSLAVHAAALLGLIALSMAAPDDLPITTHGRVADFPGVVVHAAPAPAGPARRPAIRRSAPTPRLDALPAETALVEEPFDDPFGRVSDPADVSGCVGCEPGVGGGGDGPPGGIGTGPALASVDPAPVRVGGHIQPPRKVRHVDPVYPELARRAGVTGIVILECVIDLEGRIRSVGVLRGHPLLDAAATDAVRQWTYRPTLLNGVPVEIVMTVTVRFATR